MKLGGLLVGERRERERRRVQLAAAPARSSLEKLRPGGRNDEERHVGHPVDELVEEVEQALVGPVDVLDHEDERALVRERFEEAPPRRECSLRLSPPSSLSLAETDSASRCARPSGFVASCRRASSTAIRDLRAATRRCVLLVRCRLRLDDLAKRPERDSVAVREAATLTPGDQLRVGLDDRASARRRGGSCRSQARPRE